MSRSIVYEQLTGLSKHLSEILRRKQFTIADRSRLIEIGEEIRNAAEHMTQCDGCDRVVESIATITIDGETAKLCPQCGVQALRDGHIVLREEAPPPSEKHSSPRTSRPRGGTTKSPDDRSAEPPSPEKPAKSTTELYAEVEVASGLSKNEIKRVHKVIEGIAIPMDAEKTLAYVKAELKGDRKKMDEAKIEKAIPLLLEAS